MRVLPALLPGYPAVGALGFFAERRSVEEYERLFEIANEELGRLLTLEDSRLRLYHQAIRDPLTGLFNRRHILDMLKIEVDQCARFGQSLSLMLLDLDHFKAVNDRFGHAIGDQVLSVMAQRMSFGLAEGGSAGPHRRRGIPGLWPPDGSGGHPGAGGAALRACRPGTPAGPPPERPRDPEHRLATWEGSADTMERMLDRADKALYQAKAEGRDRVIG